MMARTMASRNRVKRQVAGFALLALGCAWLAAQEEQPETGREVTLITVQDAIGPATSDYIAKGIAYAEERGAELIVIEMDTPGGLDTAMREIIQAILGSTVPVATYVYPQGARAASAGTYILYASHIAAMAPATNTGAATPVAIGGTSPISLPESPDAADDAEDADGAEQDGEVAAGEEGEDGEAAARGDGAESAPAAESFPQPATATERKAVNDAVAYILSLAEQRGRNAEWAERAVRLGESISARAALENNVIDVVADDLADLLEQIDGLSVTVDGEEIVLATEGLISDRFEPDWRTRLLAVITNPTVAYMLMLLGVYGLVFEGYNPGAIVPGVVGAISLLLALFAFQVLPVNYAGLALMLLGLILMISEFLVPSFGALGIGGVAAFVFGSVILIDTDVPGFAVSTPLIAAIAATGGTALLGLVWFAMKSRVRPVVSGTEEMTLMTASALEDFETDGGVWVHGERWQARSAESVTKGQTLKVTKVDGLLLFVEPVDRN